jgi:mannitol-1-phosphate/altronate dehydrogenase
MASKIRKAPPAMKDYTPEQVARMKELLQAEEAAIASKDANRIKRICDPSNWSISLQTTETGVNYLSVHNQSAHGRSKGWTFRGTTLPLILGDIEAPKAFPLSGSKKLLNEIRAWHEANPGKLTP